jgi:hypothetical protein
MCSVSAASLLPISTHWPASKARSARKWPLEQSTDNALALLPFPDPRLTLGAAKTLAKGCSPAYRALAENIASIVPSR